MPGTFSSYKTFMEKSSGVHDEHHCARNQHSPFIYSVIGIELTLQWNHGTGVYSINSVGQFIPFVIGLVGFSKVIYEPIKEVGFTPYLYLQYLTDVKKYKLGKRETDGMSGDNENDAEFDYEKNAVSKSRNRNRMAMPNWKQRARIEDWDIWVSLSLWSMSLFASGEKMASGGELQTRLLAYSLPIVSHTHWFCWEMHRFRPLMAASNSTRKVGHKASELLDSLRLLIPITLGPQTVFGYRTVDVPFSLQGIS